MKVYHNDEKNTNKRNEPFFIKMVHYLVTFGFSVIFWVVYYFLASYFKNNNNFKEINVKLINFFVKLIYFFNVIFLRKNIFKAFENDKMPKKGCFVIFNHVNEFEYPYDFYFGNGVPMFDMGTKKLGPLFNIINRMGVALLSGKNIKKSIEEMNEYLKITNIIFYPEGERTFSNIPKTYKRGILKLVYEGKHGIIIFYKGGMAKLDNNLFYYCSEIIHSDKFETFEDFYQFIVLKNKSFVKAANED